MARDDTPSGREVDGMLQKLEQRIDTLKKRYERYFLGVERRPPTAMRKQVVREVFELEQTFINNTAQRFRLRSLVQRFNTLKTRWNRIMRQIEEGTYHRDRKRAARNKRKRKKERKEDKDQQAAYELNPDDDFIEDLQDIEMEEVFAQPREPQPQQRQRQQNKSQPAASASPQQQKPAQKQRSKAEKERIKQQRLAEIQAKLGISQNSGGSGAGQPSTPQKSTPPSKQKKSPQKSSRKKKLQKLKRNLDKKKKKSSKPRSATSSGGQRRIVRRSSDDKS